MACARLGDLAIIGDLATSDVFLKNGLVYGDVTNVELRRLFRTRLRLTWEITNVISVHVCEQR